MLELACDYSRRPLVVMLIMALAGNVPVCTTMATTTTTVSKCRVKLPQPQLPQPQRRPQQPQLRPLQQPRLPPSVRYV